MFGRKRIKELEAEVESYQMRCRDWAKNATYWRRSWETVSDELAAERSKREQSYTQQRAVIEDKGATIRRQGARISELQSLVTAEKAKVAELKDRPTATYTFVQTQDAPNGHYQEADPEAERIAKLPRCGSTKKCPACGNAALRRFAQCDDVNTVAPPDSHKYLKVQCLECRHDEIQERPLFNQGAK